MSGKLMKYQWQFLITTGLAIAAVLVPIWLTKNPSEGKALSFSLVSNAPIQTIDNELVPGLEILIDGKALKNPNVSVVELRNYGDTAIRTSDYESDISFGFGENVKIVRTQVLETIPPGVVVKAKLEDGIVHVEPMLLNPLDSIILTVLSEGEINDLSVFTRIAGVSSVMILDESAKQENHSLAYLSLVVAPLIAVAFSALILLAKNPLKFPESIILPRKLSILLLSIISMTYVSVFLYGLDRIWTEVWWKQLLAIYGLLIASLPLGFWISRVRRDGLEVEGAKR